MNVITLAYITPSERAIAVEFVAGLTRENIELIASVSADGNQFVIKTTGGY